MVTKVIGTSATKTQSFRQDSPIAARLDSAQRRNLSVEILARTEPIVRLADRLGVSRKFCYRQAAKASEALDEAFEPSAPDEKVLFHVPVTKDWLRQFVLAQVLIGHTSFRGVMEIIEAVFDYRRISIGTIHNIVRDTVSEARLVNDAQDLSDIHVGAHDEIYQTGQPVLVGADVRSTYCYLLSAEEHCDEATWGVRLLEKSDQGLRPDYTIADGGQALRAGQAAAWEDVPCHGDVFHAERELGKLAFCLTNRAAGCTRTRQKIERKMERIRRSGKTQNRSLACKLKSARKAEAQAVALAEDLRTLAGWMKDDILSLAGPDLADRRELFDFVVAELCRCEAFDSRRIRPVRRRLQWQRENLLAFVGILDERFADMAMGMKVSSALVHGVCELQGMDRNRPAYWRREAQLRQRLRHNFHRVQTAVREVLAETPRASSIVENLNSRLRNYFFLRRHIGNEYLDLLRFFLNHRRFVRSDRPERVGKSPAELLTGKPHPHWLEVLGFERFRRN